MRKKICFVVAAPTSADGFLTEQIIKLRETYDIYLAANGNYGDGWKNVDINDFYSFPIQRKISLLKDIKALFCLTRYFSKMKFDAVHSVTPKAGLICALAGFLAGVKHRTHTFTGQVWATRKGLMRLLLKSLDWVTAHLDNHILVDGEGQRRFLIREGVVSDAKSRVLGNGSICGVKTDKFEPSIEVRKRMRKEWGLSEEKVIFVFLGRLNRDKGCYELLSAYNEVVKSCPNAFLLMFGHVEEDVLGHLSEYNNLKENTNFLFGGFTKEPHNVLKACDIFVLPTYREGFGVSVIEASCVGLPVITSDAYGVVDASVNGVTGLQVPVGNSQLLKDAMERLYNDSELRSTLGKNGRERILQLFRTDVIVDAWVEFYNGLQ